jgi:hypothetical protein
MVFSGARAVQEKSGTQTPGLPGQQRLAVLRVTGTIVGLPLPSVFNGASRGSDNFHARLNCR